jgi:hypothetical protein
MKPRFINELHAFIEVEDGRITAHGHRDRATSAAPPFGWRPPP